MFEDRFFSDYTSEQINLLGEHLFRDTVPFSPEKHFVESSVFRDGDDVFVLVYRLKVHPES